MPSVPISVQNANQPGGPVILGADGKIPSSAIPASSGGGGGGGSVQPLVIRCTDDNMDEGRPYYWTSPYSYSDILAALSSGAQILVYADFRIWEYEDERKVFTEPIDTLRIDSYYGWPEIPDFGEHEWAYSEISIETHTIQFEYNYAENNELKSQFYNTKSQSVVGNPDEIIFVDSEEDMLDAHPVFYYYVDGN